MTKLYLNHLFKIIMNDQRKVSDHTKDQALLCALKICEEVKT